MAEYRTIIGVVKFEPREATAKLSDGEDEVRNIVVRQTGVREQAIDVRATIWPSHAHIAVDQGDVVVLEGKFSVNKTKNNEGEPATYFNLSVSGITKLGSLDTGMRGEASGSSSSEPEDDDTPW